MITKKAITPDDRAIPWVTRKLKLNALRRDGDAQPRHGMVGSRTRCDVVTEYATAMNAGAKFPPIIVFSDGENYWPADGFHRMAAASEANLDEVPCEVRPGSRADAQWFSYSANQSHGLQRNNRDKESAVKAALRHPKGGKLSNKQIAEHVGVSHPFVGGIRRRMEADGSLETVTSRTGADGRTINTSNIGKPSAPDDEVEPADAEFLQKVHRSRRKPTTMTGPSVSDILSQGLGDNPVDEAGEEEHAEGEVDDNGPGHKIRGVGTIRGHEAVDCLKRIPKNDALRKRGFQIVTDWIESNTHYNTPPDTGVPNRKKTKRFAMDIAAMAITQLGQIPKKNPGREDAFAEVEEWIRSQRASQPGANRAKKRPA